MKEETLASKNGHRHEESDANVRGVTITGIVMAVGIALSLVVVGWTIFALDRWRPIQEPAPFGNAPQTPPEPRLQRNPDVDLDTLRAHEDAVLNSYGIVDQSKGVARIPVDRAIDMMAGKLPSRGAGTPETRPATGPPSGGPQTGAPQPGTPRPDAPAPQGVEH